MAIYNEQEVMESSSGFRKKINQHAEAMILRQFQVAQYAYPQQSAIRELASNGIDSVLEKNIALKILGGEPEDKYYLRRENDSVKDSNFDKDYYDPKWIKPGGKTVITYEDGGELEKDRIIIEDEGVGLGGSRLQGYFEIGYSSKRNAAFALGKFGVGAKSALAINGHYIMESRYNGKLYRFMIYLQRVQSVIPSMNTETGQLNPFDVFVNEEDNSQEIIYYLPTEELNGVKVIIETKKHHKQKFIEAVKTQLLYFPNIEFRHKLHNQPYTVIPIAATIIYEDDVMILSDNSVWAKPHILINGVNYGFVDFKELELEEVSGNIGIKVDAADVEVSPSREFVVWNDNTKPAIKNAFERVVAKASEMVTRELQQTSFVGWLKTCVNLHGYYVNSNSVIGRLAKVIDMNRVAPRFILDKQYVFSGMLTNLINLKKVSVELVTENGKRYKRVDRRETHLATLGSLPLIIRTGSAYNRTTKYLIEKMYPQGFTEIHLSADKFVLIEDREKILKLMGIEPDDIRYRTERNGYKYEEVYYDTKSAVNTSYVNDYVTKLYEYLLEDKTQYTVFEDVAIPEDFKATEQQDDEVEEEQVTKEEKLVQTESAKQRRKMQGKTVLFTFRSIRGGLPMTTAGQPLPRALELHKLEPEFSMIDTWKAEEIFFGNKEHESMMHTAAMITRVADSKVTELEVPRPKDMRPSMYSNHSNIPIPSYHSIGTNNSVNPNFKQHELLGIEPDYNNEMCSWFFQNDKIKLLQVAKENMKYYRDFKHIKQFFMDVKGKTLTMSNALIRWNTARLMAKKMNKLAFLGNFNEFSEHMSLKYNQVRNYVAAYYRDMQSHQDRFLGNSSNEYSQLSGYLDKVFEFQKFVADNKDDKEAIGELAKKWFDPGALEIDDACAVDMEIYSIFIELLDITDPIQVLLNSVGALTGSSIGISPELQTEIRFYCESKSVQLYETPHQTTVDTLSDQESKDGTDLIRQDALVLAESDDER